ncbi:hypothetical protein [Actinomycetospora aeridis]|uniref:Uncharacterized protein n=1 Tax=Actinomycetospora aeridis TaxID=3129231 RepID=A0ABU8N8V7_9PSEU
MAKTRTARRRKLRPASPQRVTRRRARELDPGDPVPIASWDGQTMTVQLPDPFVSDGRLPQMAVGEVHELAPVLWMSCYSPADVEESAWWCGALGTVAAVGSLVPPDPRSDLQVFLVDVAGRLFPLNWTNPEPFIADTIDLDGGLYLDPKLAEEGLLGASGDWCRRPYRVTDIRSYRRTAGVPRNPTSLSCTPATLQSRESLVVDLVDPEVSDRSP